MKNIIKLNLAVVALVAALFFNIAPANAQDCSKAVDFVCAQYDKSIQKIKDCSSLEGLMNLDLASGFEDNEYDDCLDYVLTKNDKDKLLKGFDKVLDAMADKMVELTGGVIDKPTMLQQLEPLKGEYADITNNAKTLGDWANEMESL